MKTLMRKLKPETYGSAYKSLARLGAPVLVTQIGVIAVSFADTMMVGAYGLDELAASAFVNSLFLIAIVMLLGFAGGVTPIIGALYGRGEHAEGGSMLRASLQVNVMLSVTFTVVMGALYFLLDDFGQDPEILPVAKSYYLIVLATMVPVGIFACFQQAANGTTDTATPMWIILASDVLNVAGNYVLIFGKFGFPELGLAGAGVSTLAARLFSAVTIVVVFALRGRYRPYWDSLLHSAAGGRRRLKVWTTSYPLMIQSGVECGLWSLGAVVSGWFGKVQLAAYQVMNTIGQLGFMIYMSFGWAVSIRVANYTGRGDLAGIRRITSAGLHLVLGLATLSSLVFIFFTPALVSLFSPEREVVAYALTMVVPLVLYQYCDGTQLVYINALRGTSIVKPLLWISLISYIGVGVPLLLFMAKWAGLETVGVYYSFSGALTAAAVLLYVAYRRALQRLTGGISTL